VAASQCCWSLRTIGETPVGECPGRRQWQQRLLLRPDDDNDRLGWGTANSGPAEQFQLSMAVDFKFCDLLLNVLQYLSLFYNNCLRNRPISWLFHRLQPYTSIAPLPICMLL
jgi:hypothetical protein